VLHEFRIQIIPTIMCLVVVIH